FYVLQAGSFRSSEDADRRRGELALLGLEATIDRTESDNGAWYRVYLGPFESRSKMAQARSITAQQSIDTLLLRRPRSP
ncbi:MAG: SPOR domain-containing protein, partial [Luminiphilus sp.]